MGARLQAVPEPEPQEPVRNKALDALRPEFIACRDYGHVWQPFTAHWYARDRYYRQELKCPRCGTIRVRELTEYGHPVTQAYEYQDGYRLPSGFGYLTQAERDAVRLRSVLQVLQGTGPKRAASGRKAKHA